MAFPVVELENGYVYSCEADIEDDEDGIGRDVCALSRQSTYRGGRGCIRTSHGSTIVQGDDDLCKLTHLRAMRPMYLYHFANHDEGASKFQVKKKRSRHARQSVLIRRPLYRSLYLLAMITDQETLPLIFAKFGPV